MTVTYTPRVELYLNSAWIDVTAAGDVLYKNAVTITRGQTNESTQLQPSTCQFTLDNTSDNYSPRNPTGAYYGSIGRNTPCRVSVASQRGMRLVANASGGGYATTPDSAGISITGDIDLRADIYLRSWVSSGRNTVIYKPNAYWLIMEGGYVKLNWYYDATHSIEVSSTAKLPQASSGRLAIRATLDVNNGSGGYTAAFSYSTTAGTGGSWTTLGSPVVTTGGTTVINDSSGTLYALGDQDGSLVEIFSIAVYNGIAGTLKANPIFTAQSSGTTSFADAQANTWTVNTAGARIDDREYRFWGEVSEWPQKEDSTGRNKTVDVTASGILKRIMNSKAIPQSAMDRGIATLPGVVGWWPVEDGANSTTLASGNSLQNPLYIFGDYTLGSANTDFPGTASVLVMGELSARFRSYGINAYTDTGSNQFNFLIRVPDGGLLNDTVVWRFFTTGTAKRWDLVYSTTGNGGWYLKAYDDSGLIYTGAVANFDLVGKPKWVSVSWVLSGSDTVWTITTLEVGQVTGGQTTGTATGMTFGICTYLYFNWDDNDFSTAQLGQLILSNQVSSIYTLGSQLVAYSGENVDDRLQRLIATENAYLFDNVAFVTTTNDSPMGHQKFETIGTLLQQCADQDLGVLTDMRMFGNGITFRSRESMYGQDPVLTLSYTGSDPKDLTVTEDDRLTANDVTVARIDGSSSRLQDTTSPLNISDPPAGIGPNESSVTLNLGSDLQTYNHAGWRLHLGTVEEPRWAKIVIWAERAEVSDVLAQILQLDLGDRITVQNVPTRRLLWDIDAIVIGTIETIDQFSHHIDFATVPERPYHVLEWSTDRRWSPVDSTLAGTMTTGATSVSVATNSGSLWTTTDVPFDILVNGERMTVTAVTGSSSPQTFTVTRSVNGVVKTHASGEDVTLWDPSYWAL